MKNFIITILSLAIILEFSGCMPQTTQNNSNLSPEVGATQDFISQSATSQESQIQTPQNNTSPSETKDCGKNWDCLISAVPQCEPVSLKSFSNIEIGGSEDNKCKLIISAVTLGETQILKTCLFEKNDLADVLAKWKNGQFSSSDYDNADCGSNTAKAKGKVARSIALCKIQDSSSILKPCLVKESYKVGEAFAGNKLVIKYEGKPFAARVFETVYKKGTNPSFEKGYFGSVKNDYEFPLMAPYSKASFSAEGTYVFKTYIVNCGSDQAPTDEKCVKLLDDVYPLTEKDIEANTPMASVSFEINVIK